MYNLNLGLFLLECFQIILPSKAPWDTPSVPIRHKDQKIIFLLCVSSNKLIGIPNPIKSRNRPSDPRHPKRTI